MKDLENGQFAKTHGMRRTKLYNKWCSMKERCENPHNKSYKHYGGKGIKVCNEWSTSFKNFMEWATCNGYQEDLTIDRIDNLKGYEPSNCRFVTTYYQNRNYSRNHMLSYKGETLCLADMASKYGINRATLLYRLKSGKSIDESLKNQDGRYKDEKHFKQAE